MPVPGTEKLKMAYAFIDLKKQYEFLGGDIRAALDKALASAAFINGPEVSEF